MPSTMFHPQAIILACVWVSAMLLISELYVSAACCSLLIRFALLHGTSKENECVPLPQVAASHRNCHSHPNQFIGTLNPEWRISQWQRVGLTDAVVPTGDLFHLKNQTRTPESPEYLSGICKCSYEVQDGSVIKSEILHRFTLSQCEKSVGYYTRGIS